ncbi:MAG: hypothetical protein ACRDZX_12545 [Acidimicrobiales bacterium]
MSEQRENIPTPRPATLTIDELARLYDAQAVHDPKELLADVWESDEELEEFLADLRVSRESSLG